MVAEGVKALHLSTIYCWIEAFEHGQQSIKDEARSGRLCEAVAPTTIAMVEQLVNEDRHIITQNSAEEVGISKERISHILHEELGMRKLCKKCVMLHHDNAAPHSSKTVTKYLKQERVNILPHPPYSPDLAPCDFFLLPKIKKNSKIRSITKWKTLHGLFRQLLLVSRKRNTTDLLRIGREGWKFA